MREFRSRSLVTFILVAQAFLFAQQREPNAGAVEARKVIQEGNTQWGKARVAHDRATFEKMLAPDFYVQLPDKKVSRQEFIRRNLHAPCKCQVNALRSHRAHGRSCRRWVGGSHPRALGV